MNWDDDSSDLPDTPFERARMLQDMLLARATDSSSMDEKLYLRLRKEFMDDPATRPLLPDFVRSNRTGGSLWGYFKSVSGQWQPRREHIWKSFGPILDYLEGSAGAPADAAITETLASFDPDGVHRAWEKALERRQQDPEGAITAAKTLLETVCKRVLEEAGQSYGGNDDLPKLYHQTAQLLKLAPSQHTEDAFKTILGSCQQVVNSLGTLRNKIGDAHGQGRDAVRPGPRHAALAVNLAGSMATFMVETWLARKQV